MSALNAVLALAARADVDVELAMNGFARNLDLVLVSDVSFVDGAAAIGAVVGQRRLMHFVDVRRRLAMGLGAVIFAGLAAGLFRLGFGWSFGEGRRLAFPGT